MPFSKSTWVNGGPPAINATQLQRIDDGVDDLYSALTPQFVAYTTGNIALATTGVLTWADVDPGGSASARPADIVLTGCTAGQWIEVGLQGSLAAASAATQVTVATIVSGSPVNDVADGIAGIPGWGTQSSSAATIGGGFMYQLAEGDIVDGDVRLRVRYSIASGGPRTLNGSSSIPWFFWGRGPFG